MKRLLRTEIIVFAISLVAYGVRYVSGQFDTEFNFILFVTSFILISFTWEVLRCVNIC